MTKKKSEKQEKFWVVGSVENSVEYGNNYLSLEDAEMDTGENGVIYECVVTKTFVKKGWEKK